MEYSKFKLGSLFSGSGGFELAASLCGIEPVWASEVEPYPIAVTTSRFPNMKHLGNICKINGAEIEPVDIVSFGSPCQGLSVAGLQKGLADERSELFLEAVRIIKEMREATNGRYPTFAVWENVPGAFSSNKCEDFRVVLEELIKIAEPSAVMPAVPQKGWAYADYYCGDGWSLGYRVLDAQYIRTAQRRRRIYLVLDLGGQRARKILFESDRLRGYPPQSGTPWQATPADAQGSIGADDRARCVISVDQGGGKSGANFRENLSPTLTCTHGGEPAVAYTLEPGIAAREGGHIYEGVSGTLRANAGDNQMAVAHPVPNLLLDDQGGQQVNVRTDDVCPTLRAEAHGNVPAVVEQHLFENHSQDARYKGPLDVCPMLPAQLGTGGNNQPLVVEQKPFCKSARANELVVVPTAYSLDSLSSNSMKSSNPHSGCRQVEVAKTLDTSDPNPSKNQGGIAVVEKVPYTLKIRSGCEGGGKGALIQKDKGATLATNNDQYLFQAVEYSETYQEKSGTLMANSHPGSYTGQDAYNDMLVVGKEQPIAIDRAFYNQGQNALYEPQTYEDGTCPTLVAKGPGAVCTREKVRYIVRRLTPTECARLQGFPDRWGHPDHKDDFSDDEYRFWHDVRNTHAEINGKAVKEYTKQQMLAWYNKLHTDSAEYKMWGNGLALPCALFTMQGIEDALKGE